MTYVIYTNARIIITDVTTQWFFFGEGGIKGQLIWWYWSPRRCRDDASNYDCPY